MSQPTTQPRRNRSLFAGRLRPEDCRLADLLEILRDTTDLADYPTASTVEHSVLMYDAPALRAALAEGRSGEIEAELVRAWSEGPGIVVIRGAFSGEVIGRVNAAYDRILKQEKETGAPKGYHFGEPGANDRIWNALEKLAVVDPQAFVDYYSNDLVALGARAWLGPGYQVTVQPNIVRPGGKGQTVHRACALARADAAGRGRARRYAGGVGADALSAAQPEVLPRLPGLLAAGVSGLLRG